MDTSDYVGGEFAEGQRIRDVDLFRADLAKDIHGIAYARPEGFTRLVEAISNGDRSLANKVLRVWGIWR